MDIQTQIILALVVIDAAIVACFYFWIRSYPPWDSKAFTANCTGLAMFLVQALCFFRGLLLIVHLATLAAIYALCWLQHSGKLGST